MNTAKAWHGAEGLLSFLASVSLPEYRVSKLPCYVDEQALKLCNLFLQGTSKQRQELVTRFNEGGYIVLLVFAERMSILSVREKSYDKLLAGLVALVMVDSRIDRRDMLMVLSLVYHSADKLGVEQKQLFHNVVQYSDDGVTKDLILRFPERDPKDKRIEAMGYREIDGPNGLIYVFGNQPIPDGLLEHAVQLLPRLSQVNAKTVERRDNDSCA